MSELALPRTFETTLLAYLKRHYLKKGRADAPWNARDTEYFSRGIVALNRSFTQTRSEKAFNYFNDPVMRSGYLAYFLPVNAVKAYGLLSRYSLPLVEEKKGRTALNVADIGAGPLSLSLALAFHLVDLLKADPGKTISLRIDAYEQNKKIVADGKAVLFDYLRAEKMEKRIEVRVNEYSGSFVPHLKGHRGYDLILAGNVLNEFEERGDQVRLALRLLENFGKPGTVALFLEPGSKKFTRDLQHVRDEIIENTDYRVLGPCLHQDKCPLNLTAKSDWCNFTQRWRAPQFIRDFDEITDLKKTHLLYSWLLVRNDAKNVPAFEPTEFVAISDLMTQKGRYEVLGCGPSGRVRFMRSHRDASTENAAFETLRRGTRFSVPDYGPNGKFNLDLNAPVRAKDRVRIVSH